VLFESAAKPGEPADEKAWHQRTWIRALVLVIIVLVAAVFIVRGRLASTKESADDKQQQANASASDITKDAKSYVFKKHWRIGNLPCDYLGGAYSYFDNEHGEVLVAQGVHRYPSPQTRATYSDLSSSGFTLTMTTYAPDSVANQLKDPNAISGTQVLYVKLISGDNIEVRLEETILDFEAMLQHVKKYKVTSETNTMTACKDEAAPGSSENDALHPTTSSDSSGALQQPNTSTHSIGFAEFSAPSITSNSIRVTPGPGFAYYPTFGGNWRITLRGGGFDGTFSVPTEGRYDLVVTHLTSAAPSCPGNGFSPITIQVNSLAVVENYDPAEHHNGSHEWVTDRWSIEARAGQNSLRWTTGSLCTHYWIQRIELER
jgi:hypothetical protein